MPWPPRVFSCRTTPLELFLNYDCDVDEKNIFELASEKVLRRSHTPSEDSDNPDQPCGYRYFQKTGYVPNPSAVAAWLAAAFGVWDIVEEHGATFRSLPEPCGSCSNDGVPLG